MGSGAVSTDEIVAAFREQTGHDLSLHPPLPEDIRKAVGLPRIETLSFTRITEKPDGTLDDETDPRLRRRFGEFTLFVFENRRARDSRLPEATPDESGIYWTEQVAELRPDVGSYWLADLPLWDNVTLRWTSDTGGPTTSQQWRELKSVLESVAPLY